MHVTIDEHVIRIAVIRLQGRIDAFTAPQLREQLDARAGAGVNRFVVDLCDVTLLDSAGMAVLVSLLKRARQAGGEVSLTWPSDEAARRTLRLTKFDRIFPMAEDSAAGLRALGGY